MPKFVALVLAFLRSYLVFWLLILLFIASSWSLFHPGFFRVHDYVHGARIAEMYRGLAEGHLPVRWSENFGYGYGMPLYLFYAPLPYYVGALFYWLTFDVILSVRLLFLIANLGTVIGGYFLGRKLYGTTGGIIVSAAITLAPYRAVNLFVRGALSEAWAIMWMPWIVYYGLQFLTPTDKKNKRSALAGLILSLVGIMLSHNLTTLMFVPISFGFLALHYLLTHPSTWWSKLQQLTIVAFGYVLAGGLAAFYMVPAVAEKHFTQIDSILSGYFHYSHHFLYIRQFFNPTWGFRGSEWGPNDGISFFLGWGQWVGLVAVAGLIGWQLVAWFQKRSKKTLPTKALALALLSFCIIGASLFLSLLKSKFLWDALPLLPFIQFPWRWLSVAIIFIALIAGVGTQLLATRRTIWIYGSVLLVCLLTNAQYFRPEKFLDDASGYYYTDEQLIRSQMSDILPDYLPKDILIASRQQEVTQQPGLKPRNEGELVRESDEVKSKLREILVDQGHQKLLNVDLHEETPLTFTVAYFPGWKAEVDHQPVEVTKSPEGLVDVMVPKSKHTVALYFGRTPIRVIADVMSALSFLVFIYIVLPKPTYDHHRA